MLDWRCVTDGDRAGIGEASCAFHRTDHAGETLAVRVDGGVGPWATLPTRARLSRRCSATGLDLLLCEATYTAEHEGTAGHLSGRQAGAAARRRRPGDWSSTHRWPTVDAAAVAEEAAKAFGGRWSRRRSERTTDCERSERDQTGRRTRDRRVEDGVVRADFTVFAPGSVLVSMGRTRVLCTASVEGAVPPWMRGSGKGWVTAEYSLLPGSTGERSPARRPRASSRAGTRRSSGSSPVAPLGLRQGGPRRTADHGGL